MVIVGEEREMGELWVKLMKGLRLEVLKLSIVIMHTESRILIFRGAAIGCWIREFHSFCLSTDAFLVGDFEEGIVVVLKFAKAYVTYFVRIIVNLKDKKEMGLLKHSSFCF